MPPGSREHPSRAGVGRRRTVPAVPGVDDRLVCCKKGEALLRLGSPAVRLLRVEDQVLVLVLERVLPGAPAAERAPGLPFARRTRSRSGRRLRDVAGFTASSAALFAEDGTARDHLRDPAWPKAHGAHWCADLNPRESHPGPQSSRMFGGLPCSFGRDPHHDSRVDLDSVARR